MEEIPKQDPIPPDPNDHPFDEVMARADSMIKAGHVVYQKWTCSACGERIAFDVPNTFYRVGYHEDCKVDPTLMTDIVARGCNYLLVMGGKL